MGQIKFKCKLCDFKSKTEVKLETHILLKHDDIFVRKYDLSVKSKENLRNICGTKKQQQQQQKQQTTNVFPPQFRRLYIKLSGVSCLQCNVKATSKYLLERHCSASHPDNKVANASSVHDDEGQGGDALPSVDNKVVNGHNRKVMKTIKRLKMAPKPKRKGVKMCKNSAVKTYLKRGGKKLKSNSEVVDIFDWFSNEIEETTNDLEDDPAKSDAAQLGLPLTAASVTADSQVEDEFVKEDCKENLTKRGNCLDTELNCAKEKTRRGSEGLSQTSDQSDSDSGFPDELTRFSFTEEEDCGTLAPFKSVRKCSTDCADDSSKNDPKSGRPDPRMSLADLNNIIQTVEPTDRQNCSEDSEHGVVEKSSSTSPSDPQNCATESHAKSDQKKPKADCKVSEKESQDEATKDMKCEKEIPEEDHDATKPEPETAGTAETDSPTRLRERKRKKMFAEIDDYDKDLKKAIRLSKIYAAEEQKKGSNRPSTSSLTDSSSTTTSTTTTTVEVQQMMKKKKWKPADMFKDLNVCWSEEDFESTEIVFLNPANGRDDISKHDSKVKSESSVCHYCNFHATSLFSMRQHVANNHLNKVEPIVGIQAEFRWMVCENKDTKLVCCAVCDLRIENLSHLLQHYREVHEKATRKNVNTFRSKFKRERGNSDDSESSSVHNCSFCEFSAKSPFLLQKHSRQAHNIRINPQSTSPPTSQGSTSKKPKCSICNKKFTRLQDMKRHKLFTHMDRKQFKCDHCSKRFWSITNMELHVSRIHADQAENQTPEAAQAETYEDSIVHVNPEFKCPTCGEEYSQEKLLLCHISTEHPIIVPAEEFQIPDAEEHDTILEDPEVELDSIQDGPEEESRDLLGAIDVKPEVDDDDEESYIISDDELEQVVTEDRKFKCDLCDKSYLWKHHLLRHHKQAHELPDFAIHDPDQPDSVRGKRLFQCSICGRSYIWKQDLKRHQKKAHGSEGEVIEEFVQDQAPILLSQLQSEENLTEDYRFRCSDCGRSYRWKHHLKRHILQAHPNEYLMNEDDTNSLLQDEVHFGNQDESFDQMFDFEPGMMEMTSFR